MTRREPADGPADVAVPLGTDADEGQDDGAVRSDAAAAADDDALADAGLLAQRRAGTRSPQRRASLAHRLYNGEAGLDVVGNSRRIYLLTAVVVLVCVGAIVFRGFNFGIEFAGGNSFRVPGTGADLSAVQTAAEDAGAQVASAQVVGGNSILLRTGALDNAGENRVVDAVAQAAGVQPNEVAQQAVSAAWGQDITRQALIALAVFLVAVVLFLAVRFRLTMAIGAIAALVHDIVVTAGIYALVGFEVTPSTVIGFLTILGFSLYDTVVVFDKVDENTRGLTRSARMTWGEAANLAVNQTLMRSINTSVIALLPVAGLLFVGAGLLGVGTLKDLALVLFVGLAAGTYSSIFLATPIVADLEERDPEVVALRKRVLARRAAQARQAGTAAGRAPVASARRAAAGARRGGGVALAEREEDLGPARVDVVVESPESVRPEQPGGRPVPSGSGRTAEPRSGATAAPRPGARPQRPGGRRSGSGSRKRR
ncbi:protein translocase subunit SecF [Geodermatophilus sp. TF02-6]|uniref:protein translocase subunit SecF n=1 Tax=Geodermatophilus sp. TF02-6 TaxID=2250575 RepID=UPI0018F7C109|nr:protein translocase subunit SecF [Geodermatophilus sp. TF02-6]